MGFRPEELLSRYLRQDEVLGAVAEGLVACDTAGIVLFVNPTAQALFGDGVQLVGRPVSELFSDSRQEEVLRTGETEERRSWIVGGRSVLASQIPIRERENSAPQGVLTILYDRTEMLHMDDDLAGTIARVLWESTGELVERHASLSAMSEDGFLYSDLPVPLHPGAAQFYRSEGLLSD